MTKELNVRPRSALRSARPAIVLLGSFAVALVAHGCATPEAGFEARADKEYRTGSNIPVRDRSSAQSDTKNVDPASVQDSVQRSMPRPPIGLKGG